jgi:hypothetical protein
MLRRLLAAVLLVLALWQAYVDWRATIGEGYAYRLTSIGQAVERNWPDTAVTVEEWGSTTLGSALLALPLALVLAAIAALLWFSARRQRR